MKKSPLVAAPRKVRPKILAAVRVDVRKRSHDCCVMCLYLARVSGEPRRALQGLIRKGAIRRVAQLHHVLPYNEFPEYLQVRENMVGLCVPCHSQHHLPGVNGGRVPWAALPECVQLFVLSRSDAEIAFAARYHPGLEPEQGGHNGRPH